MARLVAIYRTPRDPAAFDRYYADSHVPLAKKIPGLTKYDISRGPVMAPGGASGVHLIAMLHFESMGALQAGLGSPEGQATAADLGNFADGGVDLYFFDDGPA